MSTSDSDEDVRRAVVLDYLPHGRSDDGRPQHRRSAVGYALAPEAFRLFEFEVEDDADVSIGDDVVLDPPARRDGLVHVNEVEYGDLPSGAQSELEYVVEEVVESDPERFLAVYNEGGPITLRLHQLDLLPGIGEKLRNSITDEREREPFDSFEEVGERVDGLHDPKEVVVERILEEIRGEDLKYRLFATRDEE